ncbi:MAG TPA: crotonase/enoyl-CoA hydratase family protein [Acidimicrobiales bacterium]|nr:crotonase/enoyl-CoA hydratase family protein [Acidimicrobiales bacterium]
MSDRVKVTIDGGVADVRLNRADKLNALDPAMFQAIVEAGETLKGEAGVRAVVLSGEGRGFCAGLDFSSFQAMAGDAAPDRGETQTAPRSGDSSILSTSDRITHLGQQAAWVWAELPVPVIAAVHGVALGGGLQVALGADIRIVAPDARLSVLEVRWGLTPDMTATWFLPRLVAPDVAKELTFTGRMVSGEEAARIGLATKVSTTPLDDALALAAEIASKSPHAIRGAKRLIDASLGRSAAEQFADERATIGSLIGSPNQVEAVKAYFEKRDPAFAEVD